MEDQLKKLILYVVTKQFNITEDEATGLLFDGDSLKDNAGDMILGKAADTVTRLKKERDENFNKGHQKATAEAMKKAEDKFRELTGFDAEADNFEDLVVKFKDQAGKKGKAAITDDDIKKHPMYLSLEKDRISKDEYEQLKTEFEQYKGNVSRNQKLAVVRDKAWDVVSKANPILSDNPVVAKNRQADFLNKFGNYDFEINDDNIVVLKGDKRLEDEHGNPKTFDKFVMEMAQMNFDFRGQSDKGNAGNGGGGGPTVITETPKTKAELNAVYNKYSGNGEDDVKKRIAALDYYEKNKTD